MSTNILEANAPAVAQINTLTPAEPNTGDIFYVSLLDQAGNRHKVSFTVAVTETVAAVTAGDGQQERGRDVGRAAGIAARGIV